MINNFAIRLDQVFSVFNSKDIALYENAVENFYELVKEAYETHIRILSYNDGKWEIVEELPINNCAVHPRTDGGFDFIIDGHVTTYGPNCRFAIG